MHDTSPIITKNQILNSLPAADLIRLGPLLKYVDLPRKKVLYHPDEEIDYVYFPDGAMVSVVAFTEEGDCTEVAVIGSEGAAGLPVVLGSESSPHEYVIQLPGSGLRISTKDMRDEFERGGEMQSLTLHFTSKLIVQISQTSLCNRLHTVDKRLSKWLLMCGDRSEKRVIPLTQELLAIMLGTTRTSVTLAALHLQKKGFIEYTRGKVKIRDREGLEAYTCECYSVIRAAYDETEI